VTKENATQMNALPQVGLGRVSRRPGLVPLALLAVGALLASLVFAGTARAEFGIAEFDGALLNADGTAATQAGAHPHDMSLGFELNRTDVFPDGDVKTIELRMPPGFIGDPSAVAKCSSLQRLLSSDCPDGAQVGLADIDFAAGSALAIGPVYNLEPPPDVPARFGFTTSALVVLFDAALRSDGDYGLTVKVRDVSQQLPLVGTTVTMWGVPADPSHDTDRGWGPGKVFPCGAISDPSCSHPAGVERRPFLTNPTACTPPGVGLPWTIIMDSWQNPGVFDQATFHTHLPAPDEATAAGITGCESVPFDPEIEVEPHSPIADAPSGYSVDLTIPQNPDPDGIAQSHLRKAVVTFPEGVTLNPSAAAGLQGCSDVQVGLGSTADPVCPDGSKIGTVSVDTSLLEDPMVGSVYVGSQQQGDPYRVFLVVKGPGVIVKLKGSIALDPLTGQVTATFDNNPQLPFDRLHVELKGGSRAPLANPPGCGVKTVTSEFTPWSGNPAATPSDTFTIACPGIGGFAPSFDAGALTPFGGAFSPFAVRIAREDREQYLAGVSLQTPPGLLAKLKGVALCPDAQANAGSCDSASRVGTATVGAGAGTPFFIDGPVYLTGPYKGAPYGLAVAVRAIAGPYDLGTVVVRQALHVDRRDAHVTVISDPLPTILEGIPLRLRSVNVDIDRPGFTLNPTSCAQKQIDATLTSTEGATANVGQRFQLGDCRALAFRPRLGLRLTGRRQTRLGKHPGIRARVRQGAGQAAIKKAVVRLPKSLALDADNAQTLCEHADGIKDEPTCPKGSIVGRARAITPLLNRPLTGNVYFVKNIRTDPKTGNQIRTLPMLVVALRGEIAINLYGTSSVKGGRLISKFANVPDAPISKFNLNIRGGKTGILAVTQTPNGQRNLCQGRQTALVKMNGHNGRQANFTTRVKTPCRKAKRARRRHRGR
jgi:hypothetical protein